MVFHGDGGQGFNRLNYKARQHREYRTTFHLIFQMLQPRLNGDAQRWNDAAAIWNHIFQVDLAQQRVRLQQGKHWRDQYVHRFAVSRPHEWRDIDVPDDTLDAAEIARRQVFAANIRQAAQTLGIVLPNAFPTHLGAAPPALAPVNVVPMNAVPMNAAPVTAAPADAAPIAATASNDEDETDDEEEMDYEDLIEEEKVKDQDMEEEELDEENMDNEEMDREEMVGVKPKLKQTTAVPQPRASKRKRGLYNDPKDSEDYEAEEIAVNQRRGKVVGAEGVNTSKGAGRANTRSLSTTLNPGNNHLFKPYKTISKARSTRAKTASNITSSPMVQWIGDEEALAHPSEGKAKNGLMGRGTDSKRPETSKASRGQMNDSSAISQRADEMSEGSLADADGETDEECVPAITATGHKMAVNNKAVLRSMARQEFAASANGQLNSAHFSSGEEAARASHPAFITNTSPSTREADRTPQSQRRSNLDRPKFIRSKAYERKYGTSGASAPAKTRATGSGLKQMESVQGGAGDGSNQRGSSSPVTRFSSASTISSAPPLPFVHSKDIEWLYDTPYATTLSDTTVPGLNITEGNNSIHQHGGRALRGVLNEAEKDFVTCIAKKCEQCQPTSINTLSSTRRNTLDRPFVHSCCIKHNNMYGTDEFVLIKGMNWDWQEPFTGAMRCGEVEFKDGMTRKAFLCAGEVCETCKRYVETGDMAPSNEKKSA